MKKIRTRIHYLYCFYLILFCTDGLAQDQSIRVRDLPSLIVEERLNNSNSVGVLDQGGYLPLQPATRIGGAIFYNQFGWKSKLSLIHAFGHNKTASSTFYYEPRTDAYNKLDFSISKSQALSKVLLTYYLQANNLLNDTIRFSTTVDTLRMYAPQPGRALIVGIKVDY